jgi:hypothetical protein
MEHTNIQAISAQDWILPISNRVIGIGVGIGIEKD